MKLDDLTCSLSVDRIVVHQHKDCHDFHKAIHEAGRAALQFETNVEFIDWQGKSWTIDYLYGLRKVIYADIEKKAQESEEENAPDNV